MKVIAVSTSVKTGTKKTNVPYIQLVIGSGVKGDAHAGLDPKRQVSILAQESIDAMNAQNLLSLKPGDFAENITTQGLTLHTLPVGTIFKIGTAVMELSQIGKSCHHGCEIKKAVGNCIMPTEGIFAKVVEEGIIKPGDEITLLV